MPGIARARVADRPLGTAIAASRYRLPPDCRGEQVGLTVGGSLLPESSWRLRHLAGVLTNVVG
jgi:hypothetical protein